MLSRTETIVLQGLKGRKVDIEADIAPGLPYFTVIGLGDTAVKEASERVKRAVINSGFQYPRGRVTVNLSPAYIHKKGSHYDLGIAIAILLASGELSEKMQDERNGRILIGELALDGRVLAVKGALPMLITAAESGNMKEILLPEENCAEASLVAARAGINLIPVKSLKEAACHIAGGNIGSYKGSFPLRTADLPDFADVKGHSAAKAAIAAAMAGAHSLLMVGAPGAGKTMLAKGAPGLLPPMSLEEQMEASAVYSAAGLLGEDMPIVMSRPFRQISAPVTKAQLLGGGNGPSPGEVSFAHKGVLFADEMLEMPVRTLESLREPMEERQVRLIRRGMVNVFPADFIFIGATNPCRCGFLGDPVHRCTCSQTEIEKYRSRLSGPLADRIDMCIEIQRADYGEMKGERTQSTCQLRRMVEAAGKIQDMRFEGREFSRNSRMNERDVEEFCQLKKDCRRFIGRLYDVFGISPRRYHKILKLARTLADMDGEDDIEEEHLASAFQYTRLLTGDRNKNYV